MKTKFLQACWILSTWLLLTYTPFTIGFIWQCKSLDMNNRFNELNEYKITLLNVKSFTKCKSFIINLNDSDNNDDDYELLIAILKHDDHIWPCETYDDCKTADRRNHINHFFPMHPYSSPWKHQKTLQFSDIFRG